MSRARTSNSGIVFVVSSPSGAGKTTVVQRVLKRDRRLAKTVSHTTRRPRPGERNGVDYFFVTERRFKAGLKRGEFLEWAQIYGSMYGTSKRTIDRILASGNDAVLVIEEKGARAIRRIFKNAVFVLILPPSISELRRRISNRNGTTPAELKVRVASARREARGMRWYDYVIVNDRLREAVRELSAVVSAERLRTVRNGSRISEFI